MSCRPRAFSRERVLRNQVLAPGVFELAATWTGPGPEPGQFFMLRAEPSSVLLGRPISVFALVEGGLSFAVAERGAGTRELARLREGDPILLEGPLGSAWERAPIEGAAGPRPAALVAGGIGLAPLAFLARSLEPGTYDLHAGFRSKPWGLGDLRPRLLGLSTEDGSAGRRGRVLEGFAAGDYAAVYACGPEPMLRALAALAGAAGVPAFLSLERRMACGVGACLGCRVRTTGGNRRACVEGPIFRAEEVLFDE